MTGKQRGGNGSQAEREREGSNEEGKKEGPRKASEAEGSRENSRQKVCMLKSWLSRMYGVSVIVTLLDMCCSGNVSKNAKKKNARMTKRNSGFDIFSSVTAPERKLR